MTALARIDPAAALELEVRLADGLTVRGRVEGPEGAPTFAVIGGVSADRNIKTWWPQQVGPGRALDPSQLRLLSLDFLDDAAAPFPSTQDQARALLALADAAGLQRFGLIGASYGGMVALAFAILAPERVSGVLCVSAAHRSAPNTRAWRSVQREIVALARRAGEPRLGLDLARRFALTTYRTPGEIDRRFDEAAPDSRDAAGVEAWLEARGGAYAEATTPERFTALSLSLDHHEIDPARIACPVDYLAVQEDQLVRIEEIAACAGRTPKGRLHAIRSPYGHDAFLKEDAVLADHIRRFTGAVS
jgi:homoserine O-acetyltransferase